MPAKNKQLEKSNKARERSKIIRAILKDHGVRMTVTFLRRPAREVINKHPKKGDIAMITSTELYPGHILRKTGLGTAHKGGVTILECRMPEAKASFISVIRCADEDQFNRNIGWDLALQDVLLSIASHALTSEDPTGWSTMILAEVARQAKAPVETCDETLDDK